MATHPDNPLRVFPAVVIVLVMWAAAMLPGRFLTFGTPMLLWMMGGLAGSLLAYSTWWLFFSRAPWRDRLTGVAVFAALLAVGFVFTFHPSARTGLAIPKLLLPGVLTAATLGLLLAKPLPWPKARWFGVAWMALAIAAWSSVRVDGSDGGLDLHLSWRGAPTAEQLFLARRADSPRGAGPVDADHAVELTEGDWPGFRGPHQDAVYTGPAFDSNWAANPPKELWRVRVGPGWSSFAVVGDRLYTQEQRGDVEAVVCYEADSGVELWAATNAARMYSVEGGAGPLGTPTFFDGAIYACGGEGEVQRLDAVTGEPVWRRRLTEDLPRDATPDWGFASSVLVVPGDASALAIVFAGNPKPAGNERFEQDQAVIAYNCETGEPVWTAGLGYHAYTTPKLVELGGVRQVLITSNLGLESVTPETGERLWFYEWDITDYPRVAQPIVVDDETVVLAAGYGSGAHGVRVRRAGEVWSTETLWESRLLRPYFNDCLSHEGYVYGFDDKFFTCLDGASGELAWPKKTRRQTQFGCGQVLLAEQSGVLLVMTELTGELVLLEATPDEPREIARLTVLEGKTWNHPVIAHGRLYVRNGVEAACYELPTAAESTPGDE